jgi:hypothetical protein
LRLLQRRKTLEKPHQFRCIPLFGSLAVFAERSGRADLVEPHEPRVTCDINGYYGSEPAFDASWLVLLHHLTANPTV